MPELARLIGKSFKGTTATLVLTETDLTLVPDPDFREEIEGALRKGMEAGEKAPGFIGWIVNKAVGIASHAVDTMWAPHALTDVEFLYNHDQVRLHIGRVNYGTELHVDSADAFIFDAKFRQAKEALTK